MPLGFLSVVKVLLRVDEDHLNMGRMEHVSTRPPPIRSCSPSLASLIINEDTISNVPAPRGCIKGYQRRHPTFLGIPHGR